MFDFIALAKSANSAYSFATGDAFKAALDAMATVELEAAREAFSTVDCSAQPREALNRTLTHLETAHVALRRSWTSTVSGMVRWMKCRKQALWDVRTCCLIAAIHHALGDSPTIVAGALDDAEQAVSFLVNVPSWRMIQLYNPITYVDLFLIGMVSKATVFLQWDPISRRSRPVFRAVERSPVGPGPGGPSGMAGR